MKTVATTLLAGLMVLGTLAAVATPAPKPTSTQVVLPGDSGPMPTCYPTDPGCTPPIPPAAK